MSKRIKVVLVILLVVCLSSFVLTACRWNEDSDKKPSDKNWWEDTDNLEFYLEDNTSVEKSIKFPTKYEGPTVINYIYDSSDHNYVPKLKVLHKNVEKTVYLVTMVRRRNVYPNGVDWNNPGLANPAGTIFHKGYHDCTFSIYPTQEDKDNLTNGIGRKSFRIVVKDASEPAWYKDSENLEFSVQDERSEEKSFLYEFRPKAGGSETYNFIHYKLNGQTTLDLVPTIKIFHKGVAKDFVVEEWARYTYPYLYNGKIDWSRSKLYNDTITKSGDYSVTLSLRLSEKDAAEYSEICFVEIYISVQEEG